MKALSSLKCRLVNLGFSKQCPICTHSARSFKTHGIVPRPQAKCPFCGSLERHRFFWLYLQRQSGFFENPPKHVLHIAPESAIEKRLRPLIGKGYLTADLFYEKVDLKMDITDIRFEEGTFDYIYCSHVLEHVPNDRKAMSEFFRVLKPQGQVLLMVPITVEKTFEDPSVTDPDERLRLFGQDDHVRRYGPDFQDRLEEVGFHVEYVRPNDFIGESEIKKYSLRGDHRLFVCQKLAS